MRHRPTLAAVALALLIATAGCTGVLGNGQATDSPAGPAASQTPGTDPPDRTITVGASGRVEAQPDQAVLRVAVEASGPSAAAVRQRLAENVSAMREALTAMGIEEGRITTTDYDIRDQRRFGEPERDRPPFWGRHAFSITLTDLNRTGRVVVTAVENGATSVENVQFTLTQETRAELRREALAEAMSDARSQAAVIADRANLSVTGVGSVTTAEVGVRPVRFEAAALAGGTNVGTDIEGGAVTVSAQVRVTYNATAA
ncbi:MAG: SIMPL domain-containing protein [Halobacteriales archaeon]